MKKEEYRLIEDKNSYAKELLSALREDGHDILAYESLRPGAYKYFLFYDGAGFRTNEYDEIIKHIEILYNEYANRMLEVYYS